MKSFRVGIFGEMCKRLCFLLFLCFGVIFLVFGLFDKASAAGEAKVVRIGVYDNEPKVYRDEAGEASGLFPDILNYISEQENWQLEYVFGTWEEGLARLEKGEIDVMVDVAISDERREKFDFTNETVLGSWGVVYVRKDSDIKVFRDLDGKKISILRSSVYYGGPEGIENYAQVFGLKVQFVTVDEYNEVFALLDKGEVDAAVISQIVGLTKQKDYPNIKATEIFFKPTQLRFALTKGDSDNPYLIERLDYWIKKLKEGYGGVYQQLLVKHDLGGVVVGKEVSPKWLAPAEGAGAVVLFLLLFIIGRLIWVRTKAISKLRESEEKFSKVFKSSPYAISISSIESGAFIDVNDAFTSLSGYTREESLASGSIAMRMWANEKDRKFVIDELRAGRGVAGKEFQFRIKNEEIRTGLYSAQIVKLNGKPYILSSIADITDRKMAEEAIKARTKELLNLTKRQEETKKALLKVMSDLKEVSARNEAVLASIADGVMVVDKSGAIVLMNSSAEKLLGWGRRSSMGKNWGQILKREDEKGNFVSEEDGAIKNALTEGTTSLPSVAGAFYYVRKDGTRFPVAKTVSPVIIGDKIIGAVNVFRDITKDKELEKMKDDFMNIAAHDLRTPAAAIRGFISRILDGDAGKISTKATELLKGAYEGNDRLIDLVDDFLTVSRIERGKIKMVLKPVDLGKAIEISVDELSGYAKSKSLPIKYKKAKLPNVLADGVRLSQALNNLIGNAVKFTDKGGVTIWHEIGMGEVVTNITDTGAGIPVSKQKQLFQKYYKVSGNIGQSGLGLGLYISKFCIEGCKGKIWVNSKEGKGSTFSFSLPIAKQ